MTAQLATPSHIARSHTLNEGEIEKGSLFLPTAIRTAIHAAGQRWFRVVLVVEGAAIADRECEFQPDNPLLSGLDWPQAFTTGTRVEITYPRASRALLVAIVDDTPAADEITDEQAADADDVTAEVLTAYR